MGEHIKTPRHEGHGRLICEFGIVHGGCKCGEKNEIPIECNLPEVHRQNTMFAPYEPRHRKPGGPVIHGYERCTAPSGMSVVGVCGEEVPPRLAGKGRCGDHEGVSE